MRKPDLWLRHLVSACLPAGERTRPDRAGRGRSNQSGRSAPAPTTDAHTEPELIDLVNGLIDRGQELRRLMNIGKGADQQALKTATIVWLRIAESVTKSVGPAGSVKVIPDLDTDTNLYRMLIAHQLSDLKHLKENRSHAVRS